MSRLIIVSNRLPVSVSRKKDKIHYHQSVGGVATGIASLTGATWNDPAMCGPSDPVRILQIHATDDDQILYEGGEGGVHPDLGRYPGAVETTGRTSCRTVP